MEASSQGQRLERVDVHPHAGIPDSAETFTGKELGGSYVYFLMRDGVCVYIGETTNLRRRICAHRTKKTKKFTDVLFLHVADDVRINAEADFIERIDPEYNQGAGGARPGAGRPPKDNPRNSVFSVAVTASELELLRTLGAREWARDVLVRAARRRQKQPQKAKP